MNYYVKFLHDICNKEKTEVLFSAYNKYHYKYCILDEDTDSYYIGLKPNDIHCKEVCKFSKKSEGVDFYIVWE